MNIPGENLSPRELRSQHPDAPKEEAPAAVRWLVLGISLTFIATSLALSWFAGR